MCEREWGGKWEKANKQNGEAKSCAARSGRIAVPRVRRESSFQVRSYDPLKMHAHTHKLVPRGERV